MGSLFGATGDAVLLKGDVLHAGAAYDVEHWRMHFYLEPRDSSLYGEKGPVGQFRDDDDTESLQIHNLEDITTAEHTLKESDALRYVGPTFGSVEELVASAEFKCA